jgi:DNA relaxase NicK
LKGVLYILRNHACCFREEKERQSGGKKGGMFQEKEEEGGEKTYIKGKRGSNMYMPVFA